MDDQSDPQPERVGDDVTLAALELLAGVEPANPAAFGGFHALSVDHARRRARRATFRTSRRTHFRVFLELLDQTPTLYVRRLRLHRIRQDLASPEEAATSIAVLAGKWGIGEPGRFAGWYRDLFGETPSRTRAALRRRPG